MFAKSLPWIGTAWPALKVGVSIGLVHWQILRIVQRIRRSHEWKQLEIESRRHQELSFGDPHDACKFLGLDFWLRENVQRALRVNVHRRRPLKILDLGCGSGLFPFVCRFLGHDAVGLDKPLEAYRPDEKLVYSLMTEALNVSVNRSLIQPFTPMEISDTYDVITAFMICFNDHKHATEWGRDEWLFFLADAASHLKPHGSLHLAFNPHHERYGTLKYFDHGTYELLAACGEVDRSEGTVTIVRENLMHAIPTHSATMPLVIAHTPSRSIDTSRLSRA